MSPLGEKGQGEIDQVHQQSGKRIFITLKEGAIKILNYAIKEKY